MGRTIRFGQRYPVATRFTAPVKRRAEITSDDIHAYADWSRQHWFEGGANRIDRKRPGPERGISVKVTGAQATGTGAWDNGAG